MLNHITKIERFALSAQFLRLPKIKRKRLFLKQLVSQDEEGGSKARAKEQNENSSQPVTVLNLEGQILQCEKKELDKKTNLLNQVCCVT